MDEITLAFLDVIRSHEVTSKRFREISHDTHLSKDQKLHYLGELLETCVKAVDLKELLIAQSGGEESESESPC